MRRKSFGFFNGTLPHSHGQRSGRGHNAPYPSRRDVGRDVPHLASAARRRVHIPLRGGRQKRGASADPHRPGAAAANPRTEADKPVVWM